jgi:hypothetical protein
MANKAAVRYRMKESFWRRMIRRQAGSGLSIRGWCRKHRLKETAFYWWRTQLARRDAQRSKSKTAFVPVRLAEDQAADTDGRIEIVLAGGRRLRVSGRVDRQALAEVLSVLSLDLEALDREGPVC